MRSEPLQTRLWREDGGQWAYVKSVERGKVGLGSTRGRQFRDEAIDRMHLVGAEGPVSPVILE